MHAQQRQYGLAPRRRARSPAAPTPVRSARRRPEWNTYLTDSDHYKLNQQQQLQRQLQQLSTAHFVSRSPTHLAFADRPRRSPVADRSASRMGTPSRRMTPMSTPSGQSVAGLSVRGSAGLTARRLQFADVPLTPVRHRQRQQKSATSVSFFSDDADAEELTPRRRKLDADEKASLQSELAVLERMLWDLEAETERLGLQPQTPREEDRSMAAGGATRNGEVEAEEEEDREDEDEDGDEQYAQETARRISFNDDTMDEETADRDEEDESRLGEVCHRSLSIGLALARKVDQLSKQVMDESRHRQDQELKAQLLEQELRATQAKCNYLEAKYESVSSQLDDMREAVSATDEAIHRMAQAFENTRFHSGRASSTSTPHKSVVSSRSMTPSSRKQPAKSSLKQTPRHSTPRAETSTRSMAATETPRSPDSTENLTPNRPHLLASETS